MQNDTEAASFNIKALKKTPYKSVTDGMVVDLFYKLFLIARASKKNLYSNRLSGSVISESVLLESGVYIDPDECYQLRKKYAFILDSSNRYGIFLAVVTIFLYVYFSDSLISSIAACVLLPLVVIFYNGVIVSSKLFLLDHKVLGSSAVIDANALGSVTAIIASRNEPFEVAKMTFDSALALVYPSGKKDIVVVDNSDLTFKDYAKWKEYVESFGLGGDASIDGVNVTFIHRDGTEGFKPRNLDIALDVVTTEFILYLDIDSTVLEDTLLKISPMFLWDDKLGFVQLFTMPTNAKGQSKLSLAQGLRNYFLRMETVFCSHNSHSLFYGHNAFWRTNVVRDIGSCLEYHNDEVIVTEDLSMSLRARYKGYYGIGAWVESGEWVPESMRETEAMWLRWTVGTYQVYAKHFTNMDNIKKFTYKELLGWTQHIGVLINYGLLPIYVGLGLLLNSNLLMALAALSLLPELIQGIVAYNKLSLGGLSPFKKIIACYSSFLILGSFINWVRCIGLMRYIMGKKQGWTPTGKSSEGDIPIARVIKERIGLLIFGLGCCLYSAYSLLNGAEGGFHCTLVALCGLYGVNSVLSVLLFGRSRMQEETSDVVKGGMISAYDGFYSK